MISFFILKILICIYIYFFSFIHEIYKLCSYIHISVYNRGYIHIFRNWSIYIRSRETIYHFRDYVRNWGRKKNISFSHIYLYPGNGLLRLTHSGRLRRLTFAYQLRGSQVPRAEQDSLDQHWGVVQQVWKCHRNVPVRARVSRTLFAVQRAESGQIFEGTSRQLDGGHWYSIWEKHLLICPTWTFGQDHHVVHSTELWKKIVDSLRSQ